MLQRLGVADKDSYLEVFDSLVWKWNKLMLLHICIYAHEKERAQISPSQDV